MGILGILGSVAKGAVSQMSQQQYQQNRNTKLGGKTVDQWDRTERGIGVLGNLQGNLSNLSGYVGIYKAYYNGELVYIGRAVEYANGGFRKRLTDYVRESDSGRGTGSSSKMHEHRNQIRIGVIVVGDDYEAAQITKKLEVMLIGKYRPKWNVQFK